MPFFKRRKREKHETTIGHVLLRLGLVSDDDIEEALRSKEAQGGKLLGEILLGAEKITEGDLKRALKLQRRMRNGGAIEAEVEIEEGRMERYHRTITQNFEAAK